jgi:uncharacterized protein (TIGR02271 family)
VNKVGETRPKPPARQGVNPSQPETEVANTRADPVQTIPVHEERLRITRRAVQTDRVVLRKTVTEHEEPVDLSLRSETLSVERVPVNRVVASPPAVREEGDEMIVPVLEEIMVVETRLVLKEELRIRRIHATRTEHRTARLRREEVAVEHLGLAPSATTQAEENDMSTTQSANPLSSEGDATRQIVAMFDTYEQARAARDKLVGSGVASDEIELLDRNAEPADATVPYERTSTGFWGAIKRLFVPEEDAHGYAEGLERGHAMLVVRPRAGQREEVVRILESFDPIDFDERQEEWRAAGWSGVNAGAAMFGAPTTGMAGPAASSVADPATGVRPPTRTGSEADALVAGTDSLRGTSRNPETAGREEVIPVIQERLRVGKREVAQGAVRVRSYVVETPVEEQVRLRQESVRVERQPVDRPASELPADAFRERTIEVQAMGEEAVVGKEARVVEEVGLRKDVEERTETVRDTTRRTEVKVDDDRASVPAAAGTRTATDKGKATGQGTGAPTSGTGRR